MEILLIVTIVLLIFVLVKLRFFQQIYTHSSSGISIVENDKVVDCNERLLELFEYDSKNEFLQTHPLKLTPLYQPDGTFSFSKANEMMSIAQKERNCKFDWVFLTKNSDEKHIELEIIRVDTFLKKKRYFMIWRDIDKRVEAEEKLKLLNENLEDIIAQKIEKNKQQENILLQQSKQVQMGEMLSMIAHQWRQPLGAISASIIDIQMKTMLQDLNNEKLLEYITQELHQIEEFTQVLTATVDNFRDFYRVSHKKEKVSLNDCVKKAYKIIDKSFQEAQIELEISSEDDIFIPLFEGEIIQVMLSILQNAKDNFVQKDIQHRKVLISFEENIHYGIVKICDTGGGIDQEDIGKIFLPYFTTKNSKNGTGLGLYMSQKIVQEHHGGDIEAKNTQDGVCFFVYLKKGID